MANMLLLENEGVVKKQKPFKKPKKSLYLFEN
jgi:hypothetical protein